MTVNIFFNYMKYTEQQILQMFQEIFKDKYDYSLVDYKGQKQKIKIICKTHGIFLMSPSDHLRGRGCLLCSRKSNFDYLTKFQEIHQNTYDYSLVNYVNYKTKVKIICHIHGVFEQTPEQHLKGYGCPYCNNKLNTKTFIEKAQQIHSDKYDYSLVVYKDLQTSIQIICKEHGVFEQIPNSHLLGHGCSKCCKNRKWTQKEIIERFNEIHKYKYDYSLVEYKNVRTKIKIICKEHGVFEQTPDSHLHNAGCSFCKVSKGENEIKTYLEELHIDYEQQKTFEDLKDVYKLRYDFYIPSKNLLIEYNGIQHYYKSAYNHSRTEFLKQKHHDWMKRRYAISKGFNFLVISYKQDILIELKKYLPSN